MQIRCFCDLYVSDGWEKKKLKMIKKLQENRLQPFVYVIALSQGEQNHLEFFSSVLLKQHVFEHSSFLVVGLADGYEGALSLIEEMTREVYEKTGEANLRQFFLERQREFEKGEKKSV